MRGFQALLQLPWLFLYTSFAQAAPIEVELKELTPDNFQSSISNGVWLVEHFSPYCHHCKNFAPTWAKLTEDTVKLSDPGIQLAQINCVAYGDLCTENNVGYYPQINLYRNGEFVETYNKARDYELLQEYIKNHAEPTSTATPESTPSPTAPTDIEAPTATKPVAVLHVQTSRADVNSAGVVMPLGPTNFKDVIDQGPTFVKFYAPWCGHCKKLAPIWKQLAKHMQQKLTIAEVNCEDHSALCKVEDVTGFPMLVYYSNGAKSEYTGSRKLDKLKEFTEKASIPAVKEIGFDNLEDHVRENPVTYLLIHSPADSRTLNEVTQASGVLLGAVPILTSTSPELFSRFNINSPWALLAFKDYDASGPTSTYYKADNDKASLVAWLVANRISTSVELSQETFQQVMNAAHKPLVVIVPFNKDTEQKVAGKLRDIGKKWRVRKLGKGSGRDVVFTWMDGDKWATWLKTMYGVKATEEPAVIIADHSTLQYYDKDQLDQTLSLNSPSIFAALDGIEKGGIKPKSSQNFVERLTGYLNKKLTLLEKFVIEKPFYTIIIVIAILALFYQGMKRLLQLDDLNDVREQRYGKSRRLD